MKLMNRFLAFSLGLLLTLHSICLPAYAVEPVPLEDGGYYFFSEPIATDFYDLEDIHVSPYSLGLTLSAAQIAALIAGSIGVVYTASNWDALAAHLQSALNDAASTITGGTEVLLNWWSNAALGNISLSEASLMGDIWIAKTILDVFYNLHQGLTHPSPYPDGAPLAAGTVIESGTPHMFAFADYLTSTQVCGIVPLDYGAYYMPICVVWPTTTSSGTYYKLSYYEIFVGFATYGERGYLDYKQYTNYGNSLSGLQMSSSNFVYTFSDGYKHPYVYMSYTSNLLTITSLGQLVSSLPGGTICIESPSSVSFSDLLSTIDDYLFNGSDVITAPYLPEDSVIPDVYIGGITDAWTGDIGTDVITLPDISLDGSDLITGDDAASIDTSISTALDKVATGELTWDDLWLDISGAKPEITVKDDAAEDVGPELGLPDWFVDFCDRVTGNPADRNDKIDSLLPGLGDGMASIDDFESDILDQFNNAFNDLDLDGFQLSSGILAALTWLVYWVVQFFNASGDLQVVILLPMFLGLALLFIGRGSMAMQRVEASHLKASLKKDGGGSS